MKPGTYTKLYVQLVFSPMHREALLYNSIQPRIFKYMSGIITTIGHKSIIINGTADHVHVLLGVNPNKSIAETIQELKRVSAKFINEQKFYPGLFQWQSGYGAFSCSHSEVTKVYQYIENQHQHHLKKTFKEEYLEFLDSNEIAYSDRFLFEFFD